MIPKFYFVYCDVYRNGEEVLHHTLVTYEPYFLDDDILAEDDLWLYVDMCIKSDFEYRIAEDCITEPEMEGSSAEGVVQISFREPNYNVQITELYRNFDIEEKYTPYGDVLADIRVLNGDEDDDSDIIKDIHPIDPDKSL